MTSRRTLLAGLASLPIVGASRLYGKASEPKRIIDHFQVHNLQKGQLGEFAFSLFDEKGKKDYTLIRSIPYSRNPNINLPNEAATLMAAAILDIDSSVHELYLKHDTAFNPNLPGDWKEIDISLEDRWMMDTLFRSVSNHTVAGYGHPTRSAEKLRVWIKDTSVLKLCKWPQAWGMGILSTNGLMYSWK